MLLKQTLKKINILALVAVFFTSCNPVKRLNDQHYLLTDNSFVVNGKKNNTEALSKLAFQKVNNKFLGIPVRLHLYNLARPNKDSIFEAWLDKNPKRRTRLENIFSKKQLNQIKNSFLGLGINNWLKNTGEAPEILDTKKVKKTQINLERYYFSKGWFDREVSFKIDTIGPQRTALEFKINTGQPHKINALDTQIQTPILDSLYHSNKSNAFINKGEQFDISNFEQERQRITENFRNSGIYHFSQDYIRFENDTIAKDHLVDVTLNIPNRIIREQDSTALVPFEVYTINEVNIITDASYENRSQKVAKKSASFNNFNFYNYDKLKYNPKAIARAVLINKGDFYSDLTKSQTYRYLNELNTFKYPNIEYIENPENHTLDANIYLNPKKKYGLGFDFDVSQSNIQKIGLSFSTGLLIRNIFRGAETLQISALGAIGASKDGSKTEDRFFDINEIGADIKLNIPRVLFPINTDLIIPKSMSPTTALGLGFSGQKNIGLDKQTFNARLGYNWFPKKNTTSTLDLINLQFVRNLNPGNYFSVYQNSFSRLESIALNSYPTPTEFLIQNNEGNSQLNIDKADEFIELSSTDNSFYLNNPEDFQTVINIKERKNRLTQNNLILSSNFTLLKDNRKNVFDNDFSIFRFKLELAGNLLNLGSEWLRLDQNADGQYEINGVAFSQFAKTEIDYIKLWNLGHSNVLALRTFFGIAIPIGNSTSIPFLKSFFAGGANDNRAWTAYNLGPGRSDNNNEFNEANLKLALSLEHRYNLVGNLNGAFFIDAGNIWNVLDDIEDPKATFDGVNSLEDIAVGSGVGLRYDFDFFILRLDVGFKTYNPRHPKNYRWFKDFNFSNAVYNIGINYPF